MKKRDERRILAEDTAMAGGMSLRFRLTDSGAGEDRFHICAEHGNHCVDVALGNDVVFAAECYRAVREGKVLACTLEDVIADLRFEAANFEKPLYK